ncbi:MAG: HD domain-containing protein [bacterium]|nr:HD domain-containing protein [bacterium]
MLSKPEQEILAYTQIKVKKLFANYDTPAHGIDHVLRVAAWAALISRKEKADEFICRMAGLLHDVGRIKEAHERQGHKHHDMSYALCREFFRNDPVLKILPRRQKIELLYGVRYHWNNAADKYFSAVILRDADKLDCLGRIGLQRGLEFNKTDDELLQMFRYIPANIYYLGTQTAINLVKTTKMEKPLMDYEIKLLKKKITKIEL